MKAVTNYAVTLEKLGKREEAIKVLEGVKEQFKDEIRIFNNLGILHKRKGEVKQAQESYHRAIEIDGESFFANYNMGVFKASIGNQDNDKESLKYLQKAFNIASANKEEVYEINVLVNMALIYERLGDLSDAISHLE